MQQQARARAALTNRLRAPSAATTAISPPIARRALARVVGAAEREPWWSIDHGGDCLVVAASLVGCPNAAPATFLLVFFLSFEHCLQLLIQLVTCVSVHRCFIIPLVLKAAGRTRRPAGSGGVFTHRATDTLTLTTCLYIFLLVCS